MMSACNSCGCAPCQCAPSALVNPIISGGVFSGPVINGPTINGGTINDTNLIAVHLDLASTGETSAPNVCDDRIATNAYVCTAITNAISSLNPAFCAAITACLLMDATGLCPAVSICISTTPGIINTTGAFGFNARATTALYGVVRYATKIELEQANCLLAIDPCTLISEWNSPNIASPFWSAFVAGVCNAGLGCFAPLNSPAFTGNPTAPTPVTGACNSSIATTQFVCTAISSLNPAFCAAVVACLAGGAPTCASVTALFPAAGGNPPASTRFLGSDCLSYTSTQVVATGGGGGGGGGSSGGGCFQGITQFTGPWACSTNNGQTFSGAWVGADNSAGAGFASVFCVVGGCSFANSAFVGGFWTAISNGDAAQMRAGACVAVGTPVCDPGGGGGVQS
jgi:hypothetical protein